MNAPRSCVFGCTDKDGVHRDAAPGLLVCHPCRGRIWTDLAELERLYDGVTDIDELIPAGSPDNVGTHSVAGPRSPAVDALLVHSDPRSVTPPGAPPAALAAIAGWARIIREDTSVDVPLDRLRATVPAGKITMARELATIRWHWDWLMAYPAVRDFAEELRAIAAALKQVRRMEPPTLRIGRCPVVVVIVPLPDGKTLDLECGAMLRVRTDAAEIKCRNCRTIWPRSQWHELGDPWADYSHLSTELGVPVGTLWRWASKDGWEVGGTRARRVVRRVDALASYQKYKGTRVLGEAATG